LIVGAPAVAAVEEADMVEDYRGAGDLVELHYPIEVTAPYKQRREDRGFMFALGYENVMLDSYTSIIDFTTAYKDMFGETEFAVVNMDFSYKYNFALGSVTAAGGVGYGSISDDASGIARMLALTKLRASLSYIADNIFDEPYVAPYIMGGMMNLGIEEKAADTVQKHAVNTMFHQVGLLFQLDWLDPSYSKRTISDLGLQNTYLDLFMMQYAQSSDAIDPNTSTAYSYGAGIRMEF